MAAQRTRGRRPPSYPSVVTTTSSLTNGVGANSGSNNGALESPSKAHSTSKPGGDDLPPTNDVAGGTTQSPISMELAMKLYDQDKDPVASLNSFRTLWNRGREDDNDKSSAQREKVKKSSKGVIEPDDADGVERGSIDKNNDVPLSERHNEAVLEHLSSLRYRRRRSWKAADPSSKAEADDSSLPNSGTRNRVRPRPSSFDDAGAANLGDDTGNLANILVSMLNISSQKSSIPTSQQKNQDINSIESKTSQSENSTKRRSSINGVSSHSKPAKPKEKEKKKKKEEGTSFAPLTEKEGSFNHLVGIYNLCLTYFASGKFEEAMGRILNSFVTSMDSLNRIFERDEERDKGNPMVESHDMETLQQLIMTTRMAFLVLDCLFSLHDGNGTGLAPIHLSPEMQDSETDSHDNFKRHSISAEEIIEWIEKIALRISETKGENFLNNSFGSYYEEHYESFQHDELKFRLHLYRSKMLFLGNSSVERGDTSAFVEANDVETRTRLSKKELKSAMDIYQNKLCVDDRSKELNSTDKFTRHGGSKGGGGGSRQMSSTFRSSSGKNQDGSETTSVTSMAGGSLVTSVSDALWSDSKSGGVPRATFEGIPNKTSTLQVQQPMTQQPSLPEIVKKESPDLEIQHELALYSKANFEYLRGNTTKSLKLCSEARSSGRKSRNENREKEGGEKSTDDVNSDKDNTKTGQNGGGLKQNGTYSDAVEKNSSPTKKGRELSGHGTDVSSQTLESEMATAYDEAIYYNNLGLVHQVAGKIHVALHYFSSAITHLTRMEELDKKSVGTVDSNNLNFWSDGRIRLDISGQIFNNMSLCSFQASDFNSAYKYMSCCITDSPDVFGRRARCWLRMAQSCIGIYSNLQQMNNHSSKVGGIINNCYATTPTVIIGSSGTEDGGDRSVLNQVNSQIGSEDDILTISTNPLPRASFCLYRTLYLCSGNLAFDRHISLTPNSWASSEELGINDHDCFESAVLSLAYVKLESNDPVGALQMCNIFLRSENTQQHDSDEKKDFSKNSWLKKKSIAKLYSCEALCLLGDAEAAKMTLFGSDDPNDSDNAVESLSKDFAMASAAKTTNRAKKGPKPPNLSTQARVEYAQYITSCTASGLFSHLENCEKLKDYAAKATDHANNLGSLGVRNKVESVFEKRVLLYYLLKEGDTNSALAVLRRGGILDQS